MEGRVHLDKVGSGGRKGELGHHSPHDPLFRFIRARLLDMGNPGLCILVSSCWKPDLAEDHFKIYLYVAQDLQVPFVIFLKSEKFISASVLSCLYFSQMGRKKSAPGEDGL